MTPKIKAFYKKAINDSEFIEKFKSMDSTFKEHDWRIKAGFFEFMTNIEKTTLAAVYLGYLIALDRFNEKDYE